ncbi:integrase [Desulfosarcina widdelii]|uniref:Integrase n=1 Tax=Desulfosarcina widdelii TaxID=947919 RepID=A0A5K7ZMP1_9BACT|nr:integrase domain-containing protein [Desulfosarcina widdelii]BBO77367.1 integrase [Desulfosarcina widdelii]
MSNSTRTDTLVMQAIRIIQKSRFGSAKTRHNHIKEARRFVDTIRELGYGVKRWKNITNKHVQEAVNKWKEEGLQVATVKEYLSGVRTVCRMYGNDRIAPTNDVFGIENRVFVDNRDKSLPQEVFQRVVSELKDSSNTDDRRIAAQLQLERYLGLRAEEGCKFNAHQALMDDRRVFIQHGTKGGRERIIHEVTVEGMAAIQYARKISGKNNLIPNNQSERQWIQKYYRIIRGKGISKRACGASSHGCRHAYAQDRYESITGFKAPCKFETKTEFRQNAKNIAGPTWRELNQDARQIIKAELGHGPDRDDVVSQYLGAI